MRLVYIDEAGISDPAQEPFLTVVGVILNADNQFAAVENKLRSIVARRIPAEFQDGFVFHAKDLFNGGGKVFSRKAGLFTLDQRLSIADELAAIPKKLNIPLAAGFDGGATAGRWGVAYHVAATSQPFRGAPSTDIGSVGSAQLPIRERRLQEHVIVMTQSVQRCSPITGK